MSEWEKGVENNIDNSINENRHRMMTLFIGALVIGLILTVSYAFIGTNNDGIHPIGKNAVYIAGEVCTVNAGMERTPEELRKDFDVCEKLHNGYYANAQRTEVTEIIFTEAEVVSGK
ncbi:MAG: hypothetical protein CMQ41_07690 [Gammaproteobacteria bacterium]|nr:hypothetical protein [Gammaproteobacteria bacterium]|tara:strand:- start:85 stop:435 length:351 start_codon:yes stop_codon:yes gene_type:complete